MLLPSNIKQAKKILKYLTKNKIDFVVLGNGTNVLISGDLNVVVCFKNLKKMQSMRMLSYQRKNINKELEIKITK